MPKGKGYGNSMSLKTGRKTIPATNAARGGGFKRSTNMSSGSRAKKSMTTKTTSER